MQFNLNKTIEILSKMPSILESMLIGLSDDWIMNNEGENTWSPYDVVGHLIHGEKTDWIVRSKIILSDLEDKMFEPFDRFAQMGNDEPPNLNHLLQEFRMLREQNLEELKSLAITGDDLEKKGIHPELGEANLKSLLSAWVVHDLGHITQISRVMAKQYKTEVGPWAAYLTILK